MAVVDNDINIHKNPVVFRNVRGSSLNTSSAGGLTSKMSLYATNQIGEDGFDKVLD